MGQVAFPQQMNRPMQTSPVPNQNQISGEHRQPQQLQPHMQQQQPGQLRPQFRTALTLPDELTSLPSQEYEHICQVANKMRAKCSPENMEKIKMNLDEMAPEQKQYLARKNMDPLTFFFRAQAYEFWKKFKRAGIKTAVRPQNVGVDLNGSMLNDPPRTPEQRQAIQQNMANLQQRNPTFLQQQQQQQQHQQQQQQQNFDPSFIGNVENIQGQQADALRLQEAGHLVVPASSSQVSNKHLHPA